MPSKIKRGTVREDGLFFICYQKNGSEYWADRAVLDACRASARNWKAKNKKRAMEKEMVWRKENKDLLNEKRRARWKSNPEKYKAYIESQRENRRAAKRAFRRKHPWKRCQEEAARRAKMRSANCDKRVIAEIYKTSERITKCIGIPHHVDHIFPLCRGGHHEPSNLRVIPAAINIRKGGRVLLEQPKP